MGNRSDRSTAARYIIGVDLGGTNIVVGAMRADGATRHAMHSVPTRADEGADAVVARIAAAVERTIADTCADAGVRRVDFLGVG
ncbi:MAG: hypothetical protein RI891_1466, partial [Gemmatimonadota bacterium]